MASIQIHITHTTQTGVRTEAREFKDDWRYRGRAKETAAAFLRAEANRLSRKRKKKAR